MKGGKRKILFYKPNTSEKVENNVESRGKIYQKLQVLVFPPKF